jgi:hypothetical protein
MPKEIKGNPNRRLPEPAADHSAVDDWLAGLVPAPPPPLGSVGRSRYVKLTGLADAEQAEMVRWIEQAGRTPGWT